MFCQACGTASDASYCPNCGSAIAPPAPAHSRPLPEQPQRTRSLLLPLTAAALSLLVLVAVTFAFMRSRGGEDTPVAAAPTTSAPAITPSSAPNTTDTATPSSSHSASPSTQVARPGATPQANNGGVPWEPSAMGLWAGPPAVADAVPVVDNSAKPCIPNGDRVAGYPTSTCTAFRYPQGELHKVALSGAQIKVVCQREITTNPSYVSNQSNTWWIWAYAGPANYDWYPETSIKEGGTDRPVGGVPICAAP